MVTVDSAAADFVALLMAELETVILDLPTDVGVVTDIWRTPRGLYPPTQSVPNAKQVGT